ncbi:MAG TPA: helix-turn-helix transcriptional regulator [Mycobacteriales bacterium]|nr:helix-turn-helix transcriptional regulator [Mycobacteriales bacterium]
MDVRELLVEACERAQVSQGELARRAGTSPSVVSAWACGRMSPSVSSLTRVLAAAGLQVRAALEPLLADLDARVDEVLAGTCVVDHAALAAVVSKAGAEQRWGVESEDGTVGHDTGVITWAFDGATALALHGLAFPQDVPAICVLFDGAAQSWLTKGMVLSTTRGRVSFWDATFEEARENLRDISVGRYGMLLIRLVERMPPVVLLRGDRVEQTLPTLPVDAVEAAHPALAEVLCRMRTRRSDEQP